MATVRLESAVGEDLLAISIPAGGDDWCPCFLVTPTDELYLGADTARIVYSRLLDWIRDPSSCNSVGVIAGQDVGWVLSLGEVHHVFYSHAEKNELQLLIWSADPPNGLVATLELNDIERKKWAQSLSEAWDQICQ